MSINSLTNAALARRTDEPPIGGVPKGLGGIAKASAASPATASAESASGIDTALNVLIGYIPTEVLTLYVAVLAAIHPASTSEATAGLAAVESPAITAITPGEWSTFYLFLVLTPVVVWLVFAAKLKAEQKPLPIPLATWPVWEMFAATLAYCAWAFALPSPFADSGMYPPGLAAIGVLVVSTILGLLAPLFQRPLSA
jgi:hypothetical protein